MSTSVELGARAESILPPRSNEIMGHRERRALRGPLTLEQLRSTLELASLPRDLPAVGGSYPAHGDLSTAGKVDVLHLVTRASQGMTLEDVGRARSIGWDAWLEEQLDVDSIDDSEVEQILTILKTLELNSWQIYNKYYIIPEKQYVPAIQLIAAMLIRSLYSRRQLFERTVEFWSDHFNVDILDGLTTVFRTTEDREVIRRFAFASFPELLRASAESAAMSWYLDNYANVATAPNENYGREIMELHTLGVDGPYTEDDVIQVARCFTGWTFVPNNDPTLGNFLFFAPNHDDGPKTVLGQEIPAGGGVTDGLAVLDILATHPSTAKHISTKMCRWFLSYDPPQSVIDAVTETYLATDGDIKSMLRVILAQESVTKANPLRYPKFKRPYHLVVALLRASRASFSYLDGVLGELQRIGQLPFLWSAPDGYPDTFDAWSGSLLPRWTFSQRLFDGEVFGVEVDIDSLMNGDGQVSDDGIGARVDKVLAAGSLSAADTALVQSFVDSFPEVNAQIARDAFSLAASSPSYQVF